MVSRLPVFSGKRIGKRVPPEMVLPVFVLVVLFFALLIAYPWWVLTIGTLCYLACLPLGWVSYKRVPAQGCGGRGAGPPPPMRRRPTLAAAAGGGSRASGPAQLKSRHAAT